MRSTDWITTPVKCLSDLAAVGVKRRLVRQAVPASTARGSLSIKSSTNEAIFACSLTEAILLLRAVLAVVLSILLLVEAASNSAKWHCQSQRGRGL